MKRKLVEEQEKTRVGLREEVREASRVFFRIIGHAVEIRDSDALANERKARKIENQRKDNDIKALKAERDKLMEIIWAHDINDECPNCGMPVLSTDYINDEFQCEYPGCTAYFRCETWNCNALYKRPSFLFVVERMTCDVCGVHVCEWHIRECDVDGYIIHSVCVNCISECPKCGKEKCKKCVEDWDCECEKKGGLKK